MIKSEVILDALLSNNNSRDIADEWKSADDVVRVLEEKFGLDINKQWLNRVVTQCIGAVDTDDGLGGMFRHRRTIAGTVWTGRSRHYFYFFAGTLTARRDPPRPARPTKTSFWVDVLSNNHVYRRLTRSRASELHDAPTTPNNYPTTDPVVLTAFTLLEPSRKKAIVVSIILQKHQQ